MASAKEILAKQNFPLPHYVLNRASIADLYPPHRRCGIYVLFFCSDEFYVGQSVDFTRRYVEHRKTHPDIEQITFKQVESDLLNDEEAATWDTLQEAGFYLRNIAGVSTITHAASDFDLIMSVVEQEQWLQNLSFVDMQGLRVVNPDLRRKYTRKYNLLLTLPYAESIIHVLREYVRIGIPAIQRGEISFWSCSCLPGTSQQTIYSRININLQEVFTVGIEDGTPFFSWHFAKSPVERLLDKHLPHYGIWSKLSKFTSDHKYQPGGFDQINLQFSSSPDAALRLLQNPHIQTAIRQFNLRLMKKGPNLNHHSHCLDLADRLLE